MKKQKMYAEGVHSLLGSFESEGEAAERALMESEKPAPISKPKVVPALAQKKQASPKT
jgi:hypothetical protein